MQRRMGGGGRNRRDAVSFFFYVSDLTLNYGFLNWWISMQIRLDGSSAQLFPSPFLDVQGADEAFNQTSSVRERETEN